MELRYSFDSEKWYLGTPCRSGHRWPGSGLSLRYKHRANHCAGCKTNPEAELPWLFRFIDLDASGVPAGHRLGKLCAEGHSWNDTGYTLRKHGHCGKCEKSRTRNSCKAIHQKYYQSNRERLIEEAKQRYQRRKDNGEHLVYIEHSRAKRAEYKRRKRQEAGVPSKELIALHAAIKRAGRAPSVPRLVYDQQREHWRQHPADYQQHSRKRSLREFHWRYMIDESFRLYHRSKSKRRKAQQRGSTTLMLSPDQLWRRWLEFDHRCAYCGTNGDLHMEHVIPISKGGEHHLGNIVPACQRCNYSKRAAPVEQWYRAQVFFSEASWLTIQSILAKSRPTTEQLFMPLCA